MNAEGKNESATFEDVDENTSVGPANSPEPTSEATSGPSSEATSGPSSEATSEATSGPTSEPRSEPTNISSLASANSNSNSSKSNSTKSNTPVLPNKKGLSVAAKTALGDRKAIFEGDLRQAYINAFGDDPKAPKPKFLEATALVKIRREQGENAYKAKIKEYVERNQGIQAAKPAKGTRKKVTMATESTNVTATNAAATTAGPINRGNSRQKLIQSVRTMADSAKDLIDNLVSTTMSLAKTNTGDMTSIATKAVNAMNGTAKHRKTRSNKGKTHKRSAIKMNNSVM